ncbi:hypothetical protein B0T20DRAFT_425384 [Sordaria brevicollis]|uniref:Uncharacterized protein n=1 Tax=Sordaria brevicollis TaxID=83679 RepID=A0AAE0NWN1_SORBR|nr:hypothetical protein B0T20DRAFT_425384 [Sordaria brevicollis]
MSTSKGHSMFTRLAHRQDSERKEQYHPYPAASSTNHPSPCSTWKDGRPSASYSQDAIVVSLNHGQQRGRRGFSLPRTTLDGAQKQLARHAPDVSDPNC